MGEMITLTASDGVAISAYKAMPAGKPKGGMVVIQEIFGVNSHIRAVADSYAAAGYLAIAPAIFDRIEPNVQLGYTQPEIQAGMGLIGKADMLKMILDVAAAVKAASEAGKVGVVGYCLGGSLAWAAAVQIPGVAAASGYYGSRVVQMLDTPPKVPVILHFGDKDQSIPMTDVDKVKAALPGIPVYVYAAGHGFNCDARGSYDKAAADLARSRTMEFFAQHI